MNGTEYIKEQTKRLKESKTEKRKPKQEKIKLLLAFLSQSTVPHCGEEDVRTWPNVCLRPGYSMQGQHANWKTCI